MKRIAVSMLIVVASLAAFSGIADATYNWNTAQPVQGMTTLGGPAQNSLEGLSCATAGNCVVGGRYATGVGLSSAYVSAQLNGTWLNAQTIPDVETLNQGYNSTVSAISCSSAETCAAIGFYSADAQGGIYSVWVAGASGGGAQELPGFPAINPTSQGIEIGGISCWAADTCSVVGTVNNSLHIPQMFVADMINGVWGNAFLVGGFIAGEASAKGSISCAADGYCVIASQYSTNGTYAAFIVERTSGTWGAPSLVPGAFALGPDGVFVNSASCSPEGTCAIVGSYSDAGAGTDAAWASERIGGVWSTAHSFADLLALPGLTSASLESVSCWSATDCVAGGWYRDTKGHPITIDLVNGTWLPVSVLPGAEDLTALGSGVAFVSCATDGLCAVTGKFTDANTYTQVWGSVREGGVWQTAAPIPGLQAMNVGGYADPKGLSCVSGQCLAGGFFDNGGIWNSWTAELVNTPDPTPTTTAGDDPVTPAFTG